MKIYNQNKTEILTTIDYSKGHLVNDTIHHDAVAGREEVKHLETVEEYPNGSALVKWVIDVNGIEPKEAYDEEIQVYVPYTAEELAKKEAISLRSKLENYLSDTDYAVIKCKELGLDIETEYPNLLQNRQQARDRINQIDSEYPEIRAKATEFPLASLQ